MTTVSGITPSGRLTLGNHLGALRRFADDPEGFYFVADLHAIDQERDQVQVIEPTAHQVGEGGLGSGDEPA